MSPRPATRLLAVAALAIAGACGGSDDATPDTDPPAALSESPDTVDDTSTSDGRPADPTTTVLSDSPDETSNPGVVSRRTTVDDVDVRFASAPEDLPTGYERAAVPVDAWPPIALGYESVSTSSERDTVLVEYDLAVCTLIAVWALPHTEFQVIGWEEHPEVDCVTTTDVTVTFEIDRVGLNSEGAWDYTDPPEVRELRKVGSQG